MKSVHQFILTGFLAFLLVSFSTYTPCHAVDRTEVSGIVTYNGNSVTAMILANGKYMFTSGAQVGLQQGEFQLLDVPFDGNDQITLYAFCSGLSPFKAILSEGVTNYEIELTVNSSAQPPVVTLTSFEESSTKIGWIDISGTIENGSELPLCAMVLANGQYMFTCNPVGEFTLTVPLDAYEELTLYGFCSGMMPYKAVIKTGTLPDTGQTTSYTDTFGEDSDYNINPQSYTKLDASGNALGDTAASWTMVRDDATGLIWEVKTDDGGIHDQDNTYTWENARNIFITQLNSDNFGGHDDWRLPTVMELSWLVNVNEDMPTIRPTINRSYFPHTLLSTYWSSTTVAINSDYAWHVFFIGGESNTFRKSYGNYVRAVRGGQRQADLIDNGDGTVTDTTTGLMWQQAEAGEMNWEEALEYCENLSLAGHDDWRLPNRNELQSIVDYEEYNPAIDTLFFPGAMSSAYWSSTTIAYDPDSAWHVMFSAGQFTIPYGNVINNYKSSSYYVRAVRGGGWSAADTSTIGDTTAPSSPRDLTASTSPQGHINLSWTASTDNVGVTGYEVYRDGTFLKSVTSTSTSDTGLSPTSQYCYTVLAYDTAGNKSTQSAQACATTDSEDNDGDHIPNAFDAFPFDPSESKDDDGDGIGNFADRDETIYFFVTEEVNNALYAELSQFMNDVADDTATTTVLEISPENPTELLEEIKNAYQNDNLEGVFFIGDVPYFTINTDNRSSISDHPFRALSCPYIADDQDPTVLYREGVLSLTSNFHYLHIWTSRIKATKLDQEGIEQIRSYLEKNYQMRYAFDNWQEAMHYSTATPRESLIGWSQESIDNFFANHPLYRPDQVSVDQSLDAFTQRNNWIGAMENNIEIAKIEIHGSPTHIQFQGEDTNDNIGFGASDLLGISIRSKILELDSCSVGDFSVQNYLAGDLLFNGDTLLVRAFTAPTFIAGSYDFRLENDGFYRAYAYGASPADVYRVLIPGEPIHFFGDPTVPLRQVDLSHPRPRLFLNYEHFTESFDYPIDMGDVEDNNTSSVTFELTNTGTDVLEVRGDMFSGSYICANGEPVPSMSDFIFQISGVIKSGFSFTILVQPGEVGRFTMNFTPGYNNDKTLPSGAVYDALFSISTNDPLSPAFLLRPFGRHIKR